ncbi:MAG TPA: hypothetical protein PK054_02845 [Anaerohalosphaeraceae bacterium]|nr:hypothetical protein [Anaerohalosphaeraceae bacterium]HOL88000.1 hypothetical protein [Anaerohalosphaeraceae bacterium]HPP55499.1 hypothetical protein [Anaerohalosphaeraceae bacterium]
MTKTAFFLGGFSFRHSAGILAALILILAAAPAHALFLVNNGGFDINAADWNAAGGGGPWAPGHVATGGNPGGYLTLQGNDNTWSVWYQVINENLNVWGIPVGTTITFGADIINLATVADSAGLKIEAWNGAKIEEFPATFTVTPSWQRYSAQYTIPQNALSLKMVLTNVNYGKGAIARYGFDNVFFAIPGGTPALKPVPYVGRGLNPANPILSWTYPDPNRPDDTLTADVYVLESDVLLSTEPNLGPVLVDPGVVKVADDITASSVNLLTAGYTVQQDKYYYWAVHVNDPTLGTIKGFTWYFQTFDAPPVSANAGADQYVWLTMNDGTPTDGKVTFTLTGSYVDDSKSPVTVAWALDPALTQTDPATQVVIHNPNSLTTQVTIDNTGWFFFVFTAQDQVGSASDVVNVGVYAGACEAAYQDPSDIQTRYPNGHGDINGNCEIDLEDLAILARSWLDCMSGKLGCTP